MHGACNERYHICLQVFRGFPDLTPRGYPACVNDASPYSRLLENKYKVKKIKAASKQDVIV